MRTISRRRNDEGPERERAERKEEQAARKKPKRPAGKRERGSQHLRAKSVGEVTADTGEHTPDFRPYLSTIDRADKILWLRETVGEEKAEDRTKDEWR
ncbi:hypothetical protein ALC60_12518 [Trachymyrmex zeteki]|uniref:Uncharacterized protein n=1 Tax=Mycetomoellerius zeteki TaxID=64791 RepID=A0A151WKQ7_9HYME|nr:hypothetical protein ALC60_12518 [Trachymyrmex zeteki]